MLFPVFWFCCVSFVCVLLCSCASTAACRATGVRGNEVYSDAESLNNNINVTINVLVTHALNGRFGPVSKHKIVNDAAHRHACDERCHKIGNDIKVQVQSIVRNLSVNERVIGLILMADVRSLGCVGTIRAGHK